MDVYLVQRACKATDLSVVARSHRRRGKLDEVIPVGILTGIATALRASQ